MRIKDMSDIEKSIDLAKLCGFEVVSVGFGESVIRVGGSVITNIVNLYDPENMQYAWRIHC